MRFSKLQIPLLLSLFGMTLVLPAAHAEEGEGAGRPCAADIQKFCKDVQPGGGRIAQCLKSHATDLSPACKEKAEERKEKMHAFEQACKDDLAKFCKDVKPGQGRKIKCLEDNEANLAPPCQSAVSHMHGHKGMPSTSNAGAGANPAGAVPEGTTNKSPVTATPGGE